MNLAQEAYEAYARHIGRKSLATDQQLPQWYALPDTIKEAWQCSAAWVAGKVSGQHDWQIPGKDAAIAQKITDTAMTGDCEVDHSTADVLLCELLLSIGCEKSVEAWGKVGKWYAR